MILYADRAAYFQKLPNVPATGATIFVDDFDRCDLRSKSQIFCMSNSGGKTRRPLGTIAQCGDCLRFPLAVNSSLSPALVTVKKKLQLLKMPYVALAEGLYWLGVGVCVCVCGGEGVK